MAKSPHPSGWSTKRYILAALVGTLVATAVVMAVSAVLRPGEIYFSVTGVSVGPVSHDDDNARPMNLTVTANNTSNRAGVQYRSLVAYLSYYREETEYELPVQVIGPPPPLQPHGTLENISMSSSLWGTALDTGPSGHTPNISVLVLAVVQFKVGLAYSRPYDIRVLCDPVDYLSKNIGFPIACRA